MSSPEQSGPEQEPKYSEAEAKKAHSNLFMATEKRIVEDLEDVETYDEDGQTMQELYLDNNIILSRRRPTELQDDQLVDSWITIPANQDLQWYIAHTRDGEYFGTVVSLRDHELSLMVNGPDWEEMAEKYHGLVRQCEQAVEKGEMPPLHPTVAQDIQAAIERAPHHPLLHLDIDHAA